MKKNSIADIPAPPAKLLPLELIFFAILGCLTLTALLGKIDPDVFWRIKKGEMIVRQGKMPTQDYFSFTFPDKPTPAHAWLSEAIFYAVYDASGYFGLALFHSVLLTAAYFLIYLILRKKIALSRMNALVLTGLGFLNFLVFVAPRSQNFSFLLFSVALFWVLDWEEGREQRLWHIALLLAPWANLHSGFVLGLGILFLCGAGRSFQKKSPDFKSFFPFFLGLGLSSIHPDGWRSVFYPVSQIFSHSEMKQLITEMKPLNIAEPAIFFPYLALLIPVLLLGLQKIQRPFPWALLFLGILFQSLSTQRMVPYFGACAPVVLGLLVKDRETTPAAKLFRNALLIFFAVMTFRYFYPEYQQVFPWKESDWGKIYPEESVQIIKNDFPGKKIFNPFEWGGYLIFYLYPQNRVAIDSRADPYFGFFEKHYQEVLEVTPRTKKILDKLDAEIVVFHTRTRFAYYMSKQDDWLRILETPKESLFVKKSILPPGYKIPAPQKQPANVPKTYEGLAPESNEK